MAAIVPPVSHDDVGKMKRWPHGQCWMKQSSVTRELNPWINNLHRGGRHGNLSLVFVKLSLFFRRVWGGTIDASMPGSKSFYWLPSTQLDNLLYHSVSN